MSTGIEGQGHLPYIFQVLYVLCFKFNRPRYQVSVYRTIGPLVSYFNAPNFEKVGDILVSACLYVCMHVCIHV